MRSGFLLGGFIMRQHQQFEIAFAGLKQGVHHFSFQIDDAFFTSFYPPDFRDSELTVSLAMDKKENFFLLNFEITGTIWANCDRCGDLFELSIWDEHPLIVKQVYDLSETERDEDPNVTYISLQDSVLNIAKWVYEFSLLSIPLQRIHPNDKEGNSTCNPIVLKKLEEMKKRDQTKGNPLWKGLEQFRNK